MNTKAAVYEQLERTVIEMGNKVNAAMNKSSKNMQELDKTNIRIDKEMKRTSALEVATRMLEQD